MKTHIGSKMCNELSILIVIPFVPSYAPLDIFLPFLLCGVGGRVVRRCLVNFQQRGVLLIWIRVGHGPTALTVGECGGCLDIFSLVYHFSSFSLSLGDGPI